MEIDNLKYHVFSPISKIQGHSIYPCNLKGSLYSGSLFISLDGDLP